jgi:hypothetical protein
MSLEDDDGVMETGTPYSEPEAFADESAYIQVKTIMGITGRKEILLPLAHRKSYIELSKLPPGAPLTDPYWQTQDGQNELAYWRSPDAQATLKGIQDSESLLQELTNLVTAYSDSNTVDCIKREYGTVRDFFETSTPGTQCANTIRNPTAGVTKCWICTALISGYPAGGDFRSLELGPECEHVFPIAQALVFSGLYEAQLFKQIEEESGKGAADAYRTGVAYEYQWAHRICNQVKNDTHYIGISKDPATGMVTFTIDDAKIDAFLTKLQTTTAWGGGAQFMRWIQSKLGKTPAEWRALAKENIRAQSTRLLTYANTSGLTTDQHAKVTLMCMRSYIATSPVCGGATESIPQAVVLVGAPQGQTLSAVTTSTSVDTAKHFIARIVEDMTGVMQKVLSTSGREVIAAAKDRALVSTQLPDAGLYLTNLLDTSFTYDQLNALRRRVFYFLKAQAGAQIAGQKAWSDFQVAVSQVVPAALYAVAADKGPQAIEAAAGAKPLLITLLRTEALKTALAAWKESYFQRIRGAGIPVDAILATDPNVDPNPSVPSPAWFAMPRQAGGVPREFTLGGLRTRRALYKNAGSRTSSSARRGLYAGLRQRAWPRTTGRVRQHSSKPRTWRQRKHLDRV